MRAPRGSPDCLWPQRVIAQRMVRADGIEGMVPLMLETVRGENRSWWGGGLASSGLGRDVAGGLEWLDLCSHVVPEHIPRHVHQRVAEIDVDAHAGQARVVVVL